MRRSAPLALATSHAARVSGLLRSAKSTSSAREYSFMAATASRESRKAFAFSRISRSPENCQGRFGEGGTLCADEITAVVITRTIHRQFIFFTVVFRFPSHPVRIFTMRPPKAASMNTKPHYIPWNEGSNAKQQERTRLLKSRGTSLSPKKTQL